MMFLRIHNASTRERLLQNGFEQIVVALYFYVASIGLLMEFLSENMIGRSSLSICVYCRLVSVSTAHIWNWSTSLQEGCSKACLAGITLDSKLGLRIIVAEDQCGSHKSLLISKSVFLLLYPVEVSVLPCQSMYQLHVVR